MINDFDAWMWKGSEMRLFRAGETIPNDWYDEPNKFNGADPLKLDLDGDGRAGGSLPRAEQVAVTPEEFFAPAKLPSVSAPVIFEPVATEETTIIKRGPGRPRKVQP